MLHQGAYSCSMDLAYGRGIDKYLILKLIKIDLFYYIFLG